MVNSIPSCATAHPQDEPVDLEILIAPRRRNRTHRTQDGRQLRRYQRRWKLERLFAWLQNYRRIVVRYERYPENFLGMLHLACWLILLRVFMG
jgi:transposase